jgi:hypothetical protein
MTSNEQCMKNSKNLIPKLQIRNCVQGIAPIHRRPNKTLGNSRFFGTKVAPEGMKRAGHRRKKVYRWPLSGRE